nr:C-type lectin domain family 2 member F isoform X1 [Oryctolagus cuniculus]
MEEEGDENKEDIEIEEPRNKRLVTKRVIIISSLVCGGFAFLLWGILRFPKKFGITKMIKENMCTGNVSHCLQGWNQVSNNCFLQSDHETTWMNSQENCKVYSASLARISSQEEMESMILFLKPFSYWIDLSKHNGNSSWEWEDRSPINNWFSVQGNGDCLYIDKTGISASDCNDLRRYICSRKSHCL